MGKRADNNTDISSVERKRSSSLHLSDEQILLALDGELSLREVTLVAAHLEACWSCRARRERVGEAIGSVVEYRDWLIKPYLPSAGVTRHIFRARLNRLAHGMGGPSLWNQIIGKFRVMRALAQGGFPRNVWISSAVVVVLTAVLLLTITPFWGPPTVSAGQILANVRTSEMHALHSVQKPVVYQKLWIRADTREVTRTIYRDLEGRREREHLALAADNTELSGGGRLHLREVKQPDMSATVEMELQQTFRSAHLNWDNPLSPGSYSAWHDGLGQKQDDVTQTDSNYITLRTTTSEGPILEASITVRTADFHLVEEDLRLQDMRHVEVNELAWEVIPMEAIDPHIFEVAPVAAAVIVHSTVRMPVGPSDSDLADAEVQARVALHAERADLGEQIELARNSSVALPERAVVVSGIVGTPERKEELLKALSGIPHLNLQLQAADEAAGQQSAMTRNQIYVGSPSTRNDQEATGSEAGGEHLQRFISSNLGMTRPILEAQLEVRFPDEKERVAFVNQSTVVVHDALAQAWALRRLRDRYSPEDVAQLSHESTQTLELLIRDYLWALRQDVDTVRNLVTPFDEVEPPPPQPSDLPQMEPAPISDWRGSVAEIFPEVEMMHTNFDALFVRTDEEMSEKQARAIGLRSALNKLQAQLPLLYNNVSGSFLEADK